MVAHPEPGEHVHRSRDDDDLLHLGEPAERLQDRTLVGALDCRHGEEDGDVAEGCPAEADGVAPDDAQPLEAGNPFADCRRRHVKVPRKFALGGPGVDREQCDEAPIEGIQLGRLVRVRHRHVEQAREGRSACQFEVTSSLDLVKYQEDGIEFLSTEDNLVPGASN